MIDLKAFAVISVLALYIIQDISAQGAYDGKTFEWFKPSGPVYGSTETVADSARTIEHYKRGCRECFNHGANMYRHENACNTFVMCVTNGDVVNMYGFICGLGLVFSPSGGCVPPSYVPECYPCANGNKMPVSAAECWLYQECTGGEYVQKTCPEGTGFDLITQQCSNPNCVAPRPYTVLKTTCSKAIDDDHYMISELVVSTRADGSTFQESKEYEARCPAAMEHIEADACQCEPVNQILECEDIEVVHLSSSDNSWTLARNNTPIGKSSTLTGNGTIAGADSMLRGAAFFGGKNVFIAYALIYNDIGLRWEIKFNFQAMQLVAGQPGSPGLSAPSDSVPHRYYALADNSICGFDPTYGCRLEVVRDNRGVVECYVKPENQTVLDLTVRSDEFDLRNTISVRFAREVLRGRFEVSEGGSPITQREIEYPAAAIEVRNTGNQCPLTIGGGTGKRYFPGFIDELFVTKFCASFL